MEEILVVEEMVVIGLLGQAPLSIFRTLALNGNVCCIETSENGPVGVKPFCA